ISIFLAVLFVFLLMKIKALWIIKIWFFSVVALALAITLNSFFQKFLPYATIFSLAIGVFLSYLKIFKRGIFIHNLTELLIYPGIAAIFVPMLGIFSVFILLIIISIYDIYAVWYAGFMQEMAKFQIKQLKFFAGFFVPYLKTKHIKELKTRKGIGKKKIKVSLAILGGGDVIFPLLAAGVIFRNWGLFPSLLISVFSTLGLLYLFVQARKGKFYPAMPFITIGCFIGLFVAFLIHLF
ncbi:MAG: presenilin family intramembrane aspartyl protease, partial [Candidatus Pacearchaeota archaeon]